ncbi:MAG: pilus assembly protein TadG-related protein [Methanocorpusculum sp.]|nr:pilus assembly protein TadG-related protein [Methanocorpusculum sp.]MDD3272205.1 pilus assembly protein TadG-related protein [Syntrophomonadaceae bacterium]
MVEVGRVMIVREQLQTAADSAALAGAGSGTHRQVKINVTTDRGKFQPPCDPEEGCPPCEECGWQTISGIIGNEADLIDKGEWRDFCVEPCKCDGGDCWFEIEERELMYDTHSMGWGTTTQELDKVEDSLTKATREILSKYMYQCTSTVAHMVANKSLPQISAMLDNREYWIMEWMYAGNYNFYCDYPKYLGQVSNKERECRQWRDTGYSYYPQAAERKPMVDRIIDNIDNIRSANSRPLNKIDSKYAGAAGQFFDANLPQNAEDAGIAKIQVGYR